MYLQMAPVVDAEQRGNKMTSTENANQEQSKLDAIDARFDARCERAAGFIMKAHCLDCLAEAIQDAFYLGFGTSDLEAAGVEWCDLPTFGDDCPDDTDDVWSWDDTRMLLLDGCVEDSVQLVNRSEWND